MIVKRRGIAGIDVVETHHSGGDGEEQACRGHRGAILMKSTVQATVRRMLVPWVLSTLAAAAVTGHGAAAQAATGTDHLEESTVAPTLRHTTLMELSDALTRAERRE